MNIFDLDEKDYDKLVGTGKLRSNQARMVIDLMRSEEPPIDFGELNDALKKNRKLNPPERQFIMDTLTAMFDEDGNEIVEENNASEEIYPLEVEVPLEAKETKSTKEEEFYVPSPEEIDKAIEMDKALLLKATGLEIDAESKKDVLKQMMGLEILLEKAINQMKYLRSIVCEWELCKKSEK